MRRRPPGWDAGRERKRLKRLGVPPVVVYHGEDALKAWEDMLGRAERGESLVFFDEDEIEQYLTQ